MNNNGKFTNWAIGIFTVIIIGLASYSLKMLVDINSDVNLLKSQINELTKTNNKIERLQEQLILMQNDITILKYEVKEIKNAGHRQSKD